jgi:sec-independent protein translocase protein TatB
MQMEDELRQSEQQERQKQIAAMEAAAPVAPQPIPHPHLPETTEPSAVVEAPSEAAAAEPAEPLPIATVGELKMMPPSTGLPLARNGARADDPLGGGLLDSIPSQPEPAHAGAAAGAEGESGG